MPAIVSGSSFMVSSAAPSPLIPPKSGRTSKSDQVCSLPAATTNSVAPAPPGKRPQSAGVFRHSSSPNLTALSTSSTPTVATASLSTASSQNGVRWAESVNPSPGTSATAPSTPNSVVDKLTQGKIRPTSAMARIASRPTNSDENELDQLKKDILGILKKLAVSPRQWNEMESLLKRYAFTNEATQVAISRAALLTLLMDKCEELQRAVLEETRFQKDVCKQRVMKSDDPPSSKRVMTLFILLEHAKCLRREVDDKHIESDQLNASLEEHKQENKRLKEEASLLKMTLLEAAQANGNLSSRSLLRKLPTTPTIKNNDSELQQQVDELNRRLEESGSLNCDLQKQISKLKETVEALKGALADASKSSSASAAIEEMRAEIARLQTLAQEANAAVEREKTASKLQIAKIKALESEVGEAKEGMARAKTAADKATAEAASLDKLVKKLQGELESARSGDSQGKLRAALQRAADAEEESVKLRNSLSRSQDNLATLEKRAVSLSEEIAGLKVAKAKSDEEAQRLKLALDDALKSLKEKMKEKDQQIKELRDMLEEAKAHAGDARGIEAAVAKLQTQIDEMTRANAKLSAECDHERKRAKQSEESCTALRQQISDLEENLAKSQETVRKIQAEIRVLEAKLSAEAASNAQTQQTIANLNQTMSNMKDEIRILTEKLKAAESAKSSVEATVSEAKKAAERAESERRGAVEDKANIEKKMKALMDRCEQLEAKIISDEKTREESRESERVYKQKIKDLYELRVSELEVAKKEFEEQCRIESGLSQPAATPSRARPQTASAVRRK